MFKKKHKKMTKEEQEYELYIKEHISNVKKAWDCLKQRIDIFSDGEYYMIEDLINKHDKSKYSLEEFGGYQQYFYPSPNDTMDKKLMNQSWNHHQKTNPHHWQYWLMYEDGKTVALDMPFEYIIEMLCDWLAMSIKFNNKPSEWYETNRPKMLLEDKTQSIIDAYISVLDSAYKSIKENK